MQLKLIAVVLGIKAILDESVLFVHTEKFIVYSNKKSDYYIPC